MQNQQRMRFGCKMLLTLLHRGLTMKYKSIICIATKVKQEIINNGLKGQYLFHIG